MNLNVQLDKDKSFSGDYKKQFAIAFNDYSLLEKIASQDQRKEDVTHTDRRALGTLKTILVFILILIVMLFIMMLMKPLKKV